MNVFVKCIIGCVCGLLVGALLLCFEATQFLFPFIITLMVVSSIGTVVFGCLWLFDRDGWL